ncbi:hypothetical protein KEM54_004133, partial [Ascosphaera aggregata]
VDGTNNTVMLPISGGALGSRVCPASAKKQAVRSDLVPQEFQPYRQQRSAQLVLSIITALQQSGVLETNESSRKRPIEININAGLCVRGEHNVVCSGLLKRVDGKPSSPEATQVAGRKRSLSTMQYPNPAIPHYDIKGIDLSRAIAKQAAVWVGI